MNAMTNFKSHFFIRRVVLVLRDSAVALSACLFQALSDSESETTRDVGVSLLYAPRRRRWSSSGMGATENIGEKVISTPDKWPGVSILRGILSREEDGESPKLKYLLVECYAAVFSSIFVHSIAVCDAKAIFRLLAKKMDANAFASVFGGGTKRQIKLPAIHQLHVSDPITKKCLLVLNFKWFEIHGFLGDPKTDLVLCTIIVV